MNLSIEEAGEKLEQKLGNKYALVLLGIIGFSAAIRFKYAFFEGMWVDESIHGRIAKEVPKHLLEYSLPDKGGAMTKRPPVYNYLLVLSNMVFGDIIGTDTAVRIVSPIMGTLGVLSTYLLGREVKNRDVGLAAAALTSVNGTYWFLSERILMGATLTTLFTTTLLAFYYGLEDKKYSKYAIWAWGPLIALTALSKQPGYTLGPIIVFYFLYKKRREIKDYFMSDKDFIQSDLYGLFTDKNYYIALGLFMAVMLPWMVRNMGVCQFPLCSFKQALSIATSSGNIDVQGPLYFLFTLPGLLSLPLFGFVLLNVANSVLGTFRSSPDQTVKKLVFTALITLGTFILRTELFPLALITSIALFVRSDGEKLLWLAAGLGIGIMSVNATKVPRYIVYVLPALIIISTISIFRASSFISDMKPDTGLSKYVQVWVIMLVIVSPIFGLNYISGQAQVSNHGFQALEPAGQWVQENTEDDVRIYSTSPQVRYWAHPTMPVASAGRVPSNETGFKNFLRDENITIVMIDVYERTQPEWMNTGLPPYRLSPNVIREIRSGRSTAEEVFNGFEDTPDYLSPVQRFGETRLPLTRQSQPQVIIYEVNRSVL